MIDGIFKLANDVLAKEPANVKIKWENVESLIEKMKEDGPAPFFMDTEQFLNNIQIEIRKELVASAINYCYWYGGFDIRPNGSDSTKMYECVETAFQNASFMNMRFEHRIQSLIELLSVNRFPLIEERKRHLLELCEDNKTEQFVSLVYHSHADLNIMCRYFQGFASDMFLKRASLFFIQMYRKFGLYKDMKLHVPADYQVPKILNHFRCIEYAPILEEDIYEGNLIPKNSLEEIQIRAATIVVCEALRASLGWHIADVDTYLWTRRKESDMPFHCTITTDY